MPEWLKGADCKSVGDRLLWFESTILHHDDIGNDVVFFYVVFFVLISFHHPAIPPCHPGGELVKLEENWLPQLAINLPDYAVIWKNSG